MFWTKEQEKKMNHLEFRMPTPPPPSAMILELEVLLRQLHTWEQGGNNGMVVETLMLLEKRAKVWQEVKDK